MEMHVATDFIFIYAQQHGRFFDRVYFCWKRQASAGWSW
jgi:hypothetical protein